MVSLNRLSTASSAVFLYIFDAQELLEQQVEKGERRAEEQTRIAKAREELLELKLRQESLAYKQSWALALRSIFTHGSLSI